LNTAVQELKEEGFCSLKWKFKEGRAGTLLRFENTEFKETELFMEGQKYRKEIKDIFEKNLMIVEDKIYKEGNILTWRYTGDNYIKFYPGKYQLSTVSKKDFKDLGILIHQVIADSITEIYKKYEIRLKAIFHKSTLVRIELISG
ncbi:MAG: hypothetical protein KJO64_07980, partial [Bacteroidia bacterium]|nr:hypothetical protein [Bacteroidia bacterium]